MKPYYSENGITIYHGDCREVLPSLGGRLLLTSPPYGVSANGIIDGAGRKCSEKYRGTKDELTPELLDCLATAKTDFRFVNVQMLANNKRLIAEWIGRQAAILKDVIVWTKSNPQPAMEPGVLDSAVEIVYAFGDDGKRKFAGCDWRGKHKNHISTFVNSKNAFAETHNATFPESFARWFINVFSDEGDMVVDGCCGTGTTLLAARLEGRQATGIEINERYCEAAAKRLSQGVFEFV